MLCQGTMLCSSLHSCHMPVQIHQQSHRNCSISSCPNPTGHRSTGQSCGAVFSTRLSRVYTAGILLVMHNIEKSGKVKQKSEKTIPTDNEQTYAKGSRLHSETERQRKSVQALLNIRTTDSALHRIAFTRGQFTMTIFDILILPWCSFSYLVYVVHVDSQKVKI